MIIGSNNYLKVGKRYLTWDISDSNGEFYNVPFLVLREASRLEWLNECEENNVEDPLEVPHQKYYYEISVD